MEFDEQRDYMDQDIPAGDLPTAKPGPIHQFLTGMPDWMNIIMSTEVLNIAYSCLFPIPLEGPAPPGISLQEATIQVTFSKSKV